MSNVREFFTTEAAEFLAQLGKVVQRLDGGSGEMTELQRQARGLRGSAQMAREDRVYRAAVGLEAAARSVAGGAIGWSEELSSRIRRTMEDIDALVRGGEPDDAADSRVRRSLDRWREVGVTLPEDGNVAPHAEQVSEASRQFRQFAAHEVAGIIAEMEVSLETLAADPRNRDPLKAILRRQRAMLGAARLDEISVVAEALRATEDLTRVIAKLNVPVKEEWLSVFRSSRDVLKAALDSLQKGEAPGATPSLSKLRVLRQELMERHGAGEAVPVTGPPTATAQAAAQAPAQAPAPAPAQAAAQAPAPTLAPDAAVPIEQFLYHGDRALQRALELQPEIAQLAESNPQARESIDELFDLIRLGIS